MESGIVIKEWTTAYSQQVIDLILSIQRGELNVAITEADQPDLKTVDTFYRQGNGNFWVAVHTNRVAGTIALIDIGGQQVALRKMFVHAGYRGKEKRVAQQLMNTVFDWCKRKEITGIYLGTITVMKAAHRFYERNGFIQVAKKDLPPAFPVMAVDNVFYYYNFEAK